jgi:hypothetical protein
MHVPAAFASLFAWFSQFAKSLHKKLLLVLIPLFLTISSCSLPQIKAEDRLFLNVSLEFLDSYQLPQQDFQGTRLGGLSGLAYDRQQNRLYAISDDRSNFAPARFYTLKMNLSSADQAIGIGNVEVEKVTVLKSENGEPFAAGKVDLEGIALSPRQSLFIASEGDADKEIAPFIDEFDLATGNWRSRLPIPSRYLPRTEAEKALGVQSNQGFESLTLNAGSYGNTQLEPFRLFTATEAALRQDLPPSSVQADQGQAAPQPSYLRFLHYLIGENQPLLLAEHVYQIDPLPEGAENLGLSDLLVLDQGGHFLSLERAFGITGFSGKVFQLAMGGATDIASIPSLEGNINGLTPIYKRLMLDLSELGIPLDNFEGMTLGPQLPDGNRSLILVSDDNFNPLQTTEFLLFRLRQGN